MGTYNQLNKCLFIILLFFLSNKALSQLNNNSYITQDTITISKPIVVMLKGYDGKFIMSEDFLEDINNLQKAIDDQKIFLYNDDGIGFISSSDRKKNNISIGECSYIKKDVRKNLTILRLSAEVNRFYLGFVKLNFYNKRSITSNNKKTYLKDSNDFKPILYPICKNSE